MGPQRTRALELAVLISVTPVGTVVLTAGSGPALVTHRIDLLPILCRWVNQLVLCTVQSDKVLSSHRSRV